MTAPSSIAAVTEEAVDKAYGADVVTCPWCGYEHHDGWELFDRHDSAETTCNGCERDFEVDRDVSVSYTSSRAECDMEDCENDGGSRCTRCKARVCTKHEGTCCEVTA